MIGSSQNAGPSAQRAGRGLAADADRLQLVDALGQGEQHRDGAEGLARKSRSAQMTWTARRAVIARLARLMSSSLVPLNIEPTMTS
jgi:hypothetical protein